MIQIKNSAKNFFEKTKSYVYHKEHNAKALKILKVTENQKGKLSAENRKLCF